MVGVALGGPEGVEQSAELLRLAVRHRTVKCGRLKDGGRSNPACRSWPVRGRWTAR